MSTAATVRAQSTKQAGPAREGGRDLRRLSGWAQAAPSPMAVGPEPFG